MTFRAVSLFMLLPLALHAPIWTGRVDFFSGPASDLVPYLYGLKQFQFQTVHQFGEFPLWNPHILFGQPAVGNIQHALFYPLNVLYWIFPFFTAVWLGQVFHMALAGCGTWMLARRTGCGPAAALTAGGLFMLNGRILSYIDAGWIGYMHALCWIPWVVWAGLGMSRGRHGGDAILAGLFLSLSLLAGTPQYALVGCGLLALQTALTLIGPQARGHRRQLAGHLVLAGMVFFMLSAVEIFPSAQQSFLSSRPLSAGQTLGFHFSWDLGQWVRLLLRPEFLGHDFSWELCAYIGVGGLLLAFSGIAANPGRWPLVVVWGVIPSLLSLGPAVPAMDEVIRAVPGLGMLANPSRYFIFTILVLSLGAGWGLQAWIDRAANRNRLGAMVLVLALLAATVVRVPTAGFEAWAANGRFLAALGGSALFLFLCRPRPRRVFVLLLVGWLLAEPLTLAPRFLAAHKAADLERPEKIFDALAEYPGPVRLAAIQPVHLRENLISVLEDHEIVSAGVARVGGYEPLAMLRSLRFLTLMDGTPPPDGVMWGMRPFGFARPELFHLAGVTHLVTTRAMVHPDLRLLATDRVSRPHFRGGAWRDQEIWLYENTKAWPRAFWIDPAGRRAGGKAVVSFPSPSRRHISCRSPEAGTVILTETFHEGWRARMDGLGIKPRSFMDTFIAVDVPAGEHAIELRFLPASLVTGAAISLAGVMLIVIWFFSRRRREP